MLFRIAAGKQFTTQLTNWRKLDDQTRLKYWRWWVVVIKEISSRWLVATGAVITRWSSLDQLTDKTQRDRHRPNSWSPWSIQGIQTGAVKGWKCLWTHLPAHLHTPLELRDAIGSRCMRVLIQLSDLHTSALDITGAAVLLGFLDLHSQCVALKTHIKGVQFLWEKCRHYLSSVLSLGTANSTLERVPGLPVLQITWLVGIGPCFEFGMDVTINPGLLVWECSYSNPGYDVIDAFADVADDRVRVRWCCCPGTRTTT